VDASFEASAGVMLQPAQHMLSALLLLTTLAQTAGDRAQAARLAAVALLLLDDEVHAPLTIAWVTAMDRILKAGAADAGPLLPPAPPPPLPPSLDMPGVTLGPLFRGLGCRLSSFYICVMASLAGAPLPGELVAAVLRDADEGRSLFLLALRRAGSDHALPEQTYFHCILRLAAALAASDEDAALPLARALAGAVLSMRQHAVHDTLPLCVLQRALPLLRRSGEAQLADGVAAVLRAARVVAPALVPEEIL
jgi:hypothetical protein